MTRTKGRSCGTKRRHADRGAAEQHRQRLIREGTAPATMVVYRCRHCQGWHVGHRERHRG